ncbi:hypothetical protein QA599_20620 [Haloarculaceae archaeon H-GB1-1]|nr:hypothetical protein [Haloarculaceae archaeon H-GB1-1]
MTPVPTPSDSTATDDEPLPTLTAVPPVGGTRLVSTRHFGPPTLSSQDGGETE